MAVYKIFPIKDNFISSINSNSNYGRDEILDVSSNISRALIQWDHVELINLINSISGSYQSNIRLFLANASSLPQNYNIEFHPLNQSWIMGTGRTGDFPNPNNGSSWNYSNSYSTSSLWNGGNYISSSLSQSFSYVDSKDINYDITNIIEDWYNGIVDNNGILIKHQNEGLEISTKFFSIDTHTIYPPHLEFKWNDISYSSSIPIIDNNQFVTNISNNKKEFDDGSIYRFELRSRDLYPIRSFQTSSIYLNNKILPEESYWCLKDTKTEEIVIDYDIIGTKIGADNNGNYFNLYFEGLQPERYYQLLYKTKIGNQIIVIDNKSNYFKVIR